MALAGAYGTAMAVELEMGPIMEWKTPARGHDEEERREGEGEDCPKARSKRKRPSRNDSEKEKPTVVIPEDPASKDDEKRKYPISFREGFTVFTCLGVSLAAIMALVIYVGFFWYLEQQRMLKDHLTLVVTTGSERDLRTGIPTTDLIHINSRMVSLSSEDSKVCQESADYPMAVTGAVGFIDKKLIRVCGGVSKNNATLKACFTFNESKWTLSSQGGLNTPRAHAALTRSKYGLWVSGGEASNGSLLETTEAMERPGTKFVTGRGPKLPKALSRHCLLKIHEDPINVKFLLIGGRTPEDDYSSLAWSLSLGLGAEPSNTPWTPLPHLLEGRHSHSCFHHDGKVFVVGGAVKGKKYGTDSVETYNNRDDTWREYEPLPFGPLLGASTVSIGSDPVPTLVGGSDRQKGLIQLFEGEWELSEVELKNKIFYPVAVTSRPQWVCFT